MRENPDHFFFDEKKNELFSNFNVKLADILMGFEEDSESEIITQEKEEELIGKNSDIGKKIDQNYDIIVKEFGADRELNIESILEQNDQRLVDSEINFEERSTTEGGRRREKYYKKLKGKERGENLIEREINNESERKKSEENKQNEIREKPTVLNILITLMKQT